jgi:hypothetical protein
MTCCEKTPFILWKGKRYCREDWDARTATTREEIKQALKDSPGHKTILTPDGEIDYIKIQRKEMFGDPGDGMLFRGEHAS